LVLGSINVGFSLTGGLVPLRDAFASEKEGELQLLAAGTEEEVNIVNGDDSTAARRKEPGCAR
jgi:hypothetical protein